MMYGSDDTKLTIRGGEGREALKTASV